MTYKITGVRKKLDAVPTASNELAEAEQEVTEAQANLKKAIESGTATTADNERLSVAMKRYEIERAKPIE